MTKQTPRPYRLDWDYQDRGRIPEYRATYRGYTIRAIQDQYPENPFEAWDCLAPTLVYGGRRDGFTDYSDGVIADPLAAISDARLARHWRDVIRALGISPDDYARERAERRADYGDTAADTRRALAESCLEDSRHWHGGDYLETLAALWRIAGAVAVTWSSSGYSQGDYVEGLSVVTPEWARKVGVPKGQGEAACKSARDTYGAWAWGDVYGYVVEGPDGEEIDDGSVWGFYGDDFEESGLAESAVDAIDGDIRRRAKRRASRLGELIKARVPLAYRPGLLQQAEAGQ